MSKERVLSEIKEYCSEDYNIEEWLNCVEWIYSFYIGKCIGVGDDKDKLIDEDLIIQTIKDIIDGLEGRLLIEGRSKLEFFEEHILYNLNRKVKWGWIHIVYERWRLG